MVKRRRQWCEMLAMAFAAMLSLSLGAGCLKSCQSSLYGEAPEAALPQELQIRWDLAAATLGVDLLEAEPRSVLRYDLDVDCPLVYDFEANTSVAQEQPKALFPTQEQQSAGRVELRAGQDGAHVWSLSNRATGRYPVRNGTRFPGQEFWPGELADAQLGSDGLVVREVGEPAPLWSAFGVFGGLIYFWPDLPDSTAVGSTTNWEVDFSRPGAHGDEIAGPGQTRFQASVRLTQWLTIDGVVAAVFEVKQPLGGEFEDRRSFKRWQWSGRFSGRYVVLRTGRVLHAAVAQDLVVSRFDLADSKDEPALVHSQGFVAEARLTGACRGPKLAPFQRDKERTQSAVEVYTRFVYALNGKSDDASQIQVRLAPDLVEAHTGAAIIDLLRSHVDRYGTKVLGSPVMSEAVQVDGDFYRFKTVGAARDLDGGQGAVTVITHVTAEDVDGKLHILAVRSTSSQSGDEHWNVLEISPARLFSSAASD